MPYRQWTLSLPHRVLLCDDFESASVGGAPDPASWQVHVFNQQGRISIDNIQAHSGTRSVYVAE